MSRTYAVELGLILVVVAVVLGVALTFQGSGVSHILSTVGVPSPS